MKKVVLSTGGLSGSQGFGGSIWVRLQYALGLRRLGIECYWVDHLNRVDPVQYRCELSFLLARFRRLMSDFGFHDHYCVVYDGGEQHFGMSATALAALAKDTGLLINLSATPPPGSPLHSVPRRAYFDLDPGFTQIWALGQNDLDLKRYNFFFTVGQNIGRPEFRIPLGQINWRPTLPPVVLEQWPPFIDNRYDSFTTIADWWGSQHVVFNDEEHSGKRSEFLRILPLPRESGQKIELALLINPGEHEDLRLLREHQWKLVDPYLYAGDPGVYREFIRHSRAEFSVAKSGYVKSQGGWISDRTACYLASGKPALVQSTGLEWKLPVGRGLLTFRTLEEAVAGVRQINADYLAHCQAARAVAEKYFDSDLVLGSILEQVGLS